MFRKEKLSARVLMGENPFHGFFEAGQFKNTDNALSSVSFFQDMADTPAVFTDITDR